MELKYFPQIQDTVQLDVPFRISSSCSGSFIESGKTYFYFGNTITEKRVLITDSEFNVIYNVSLSAAQDRNSKIEDLQVVHSDSILVITTEGKGATLLLLNKIGEIKNITELNNIAKAKNDTIFRYLSSRNSEFYQEGKLIIGTQLLPDNFKFKSSNDTEVFKKMNTDQNLAPKFAVFSFVFDSARAKVDYIYEPDYVREKYNIYFRINLPYYTISSSTIYSFGHFEPYINITDLESFKTKSIIWQSKYSENGELPFFLSSFDDPKYNLQDSSIKIESQSSKINKFFVDKVSNRNHLFITPQRTSSDIERDNNRNYMEWSWQILDENLKFINERQFVTKNLIFGFTIQDEKYFYILINDLKNENYSPLKMRFVRFKL
jgi:hypothetical protein